MRVSLPLMLIVSLALHVSLAAGITLASFHEAAKSVAASPEATTPDVMLLRSQETPAVPFQPSALVKMAMARSVATSQPVPVPAPAAPQVEKAMAAAKVKSSPALALEANPNARIEALPPEAVLSPSPPPRLDGAKGVVFILDISGSMYEPYAGSTRLACARQTLSARIRAMKDGTPFAIILYAERACASGPLVAANDATRDAAVRFILRDTDCGGGTNLPAGLTCAEQLHPGALVLVSDGDLNISAFNLMARASGILGPEGHGPDLTIVGIAPRPDAGAEQLLQGLADQQGGTYQTEEFESETPLLTSTAGPAKPTAPTP